MHWLGTVFGPQRARAFKGDKHAERRVQLGAATNALGAKESSGIGPE
jgi:hypothetical protein